MVTNVEMRPGWVEYRIQELANYWSITGNESGTLLRFYNLPEDITGLKILDICAGESDLTAILAEKGADSVAVDILYKDFDRIHSEKLARIAKSVFGDKDYEPWQEEEFTRRVERFESSGFFVRFKASFEQDRHRYIEASAHSLPFADNSFDLALSSYGILGVLDSETDLLRIGVSEAIRVIKPGGSIQMGPMTVGLIENEQLVNTRELLKELEQRKDIRVLEEDAMFAKTPNRRITLTKQPLVAAA